MGQAEGNLHGSGLNRADWYALCRHAVPYCSSREGKFVPPGEVDVPSVPEHLTNHKLVRTYRATGESEFPSLPANP
jgi:hypothetical protein